MHRFKLSAISHATAIKVKKCSHPAAGLQNPAQIRLVYGDAFRRHGHTNLASQKRQQD